MNTRLTLSLRSEIIERAKHYSRQKGVSISKLVESYLQKLGEPAAGKGKKKYLVDEMIGIINNETITPDNWKELRQPNYQVTPIAPIAR